MCFIQSDKIIYFVLDNNSFFTYKRSIFVHGFTVDENGIKMSKSLGNITYPKDIIENYNLDSLRWWIASHIHGQSAISVKPHLLEDAANLVQKIRKVLRYYLGYADKMATLNQLNIAFDKLTPLDIYSLSSLVKFHQRAEDLSSNYRFPMYINHITKFINDDLSAFYIDILKDRLYMCSENDNQEIFNILLAQFFVVCKILWPITPHLVEESWNYYDKSNSFYTTTFNIPNSWQSNEYDESMRLATQLIGMLRENIAKTSWNYRVKVSCNEQNMKQLQVSLIEQ